MPQPDKVNFALRLFPCIGSGQPTVCASTRDNRYNWALPIRTGFRLLGLTKFDKEDLEYSVVLKLNESFSDVTYIVYTVSTKEVKNSRAMSVLGQRLLFLTV